MKSFAAIACFVLCLGSAAPAAVTVIGSSSARLCYEGARSPRNSAGALRDCDAALKNEALTRDDEVATYVNRGILRATYGDTAGALKDYDAALAIDQAEPEAWLNKAFVSLRSGNAAGALRFFDSALALKTAEPAMAHYGRAVAHEQTGNVRAAYADYVRARDLGPKWEAPRKELSRFQVKRAR